MSPHEHRSADLEQVGCAVITVSDTRDSAEDESGALLSSLLEAAGHTVTLRRVIRDEPAELEAAVEASEAAPGVRAILFTGGTGIAARDRTFETLTALIERPLPGFGELFRMLSFDEVGAMALLSRAMAGIRGGRVVFALPGSPGAVRLAAKKLILPVLGHLVAQLDR